MPFRCAAISVLVLVVLRGQGQGYEPIIPQHGHFPSQVLGLDLLIERERLRFYAGDASLPGADDLIERLETFVDDLEGRVVLAEQRAEEEAKRAEEEAKRAQAAEARLAAALAEIERLKSSKS